MRCRLPLILLCAVLAPAIFPASAHVALATRENGNLAYATPIPDPLRSSVAYGHLQAGKAAYFRMEMERGNRLVLAVTVNRADSPVPDLVVMGPGIQPSRQVPIGVEMPPASGVRIIPGSPPEKGEFEPFSPSVIYHVASFTTTVDEPGTYYAVVLAHGEETDYGFVVGYKEEFTVGEWILIPASLVHIYLWEGQSGWAVAAPYLIVFLACLGILSWQQMEEGKVRGTRAWLASLAGILYIGTGGSTLYQMLRALFLTSSTMESAITMVFALIPIILGVWALRLGRPGLSPTEGMRLSLLAVGILGLVAWAGLIAGPVLALTATMLPKGSTGDGPV
jgi:hypothetical protein